MKLRIPMIAQVSVWAFALLLMASSVASGQIAGGSIVGVVTDSSEAVVPNASVTVKNLGTSSANTATTNADGYYEFPLLPAGRYTVEVQASGFQQKQSEAFDLNSGTRPRLDFTLGVGTVGEQVTVTATGTLINATTTDLGVVIEQRKIDALPLNGRNFQQLVGLQAGVVNAPASTTGGRGGIEFNGSSALGNNLLMDGVDMSFGEANAAGDAGAGAGGGPSGAGAAINTISVEAIQEFKATGSAFSAEYGRATGGVLNVTTKSGTNDFNGTLFYFLRNDALDANNFFNNRQGLPKPPLRFNQYGGNLGGPIYFPSFGEGGSSVFRGQNKAFFFFNYEGATVRRGQVVQGNVPTPLLISQVTNPAIREQLLLLPQNFASTSNPLIGLHRRNDSQTNDENTYVSRVDVDAGKHRLTFRYNYNNQDFAQPQLRLDNRNIFPTRYHNALIQDAYTISPTLFNELRLGFNRTDLARANSTYFTETGFFEVAGGVNSDFQSLLAFTANTYTVADNLTYIRGNQTIKTGFEIRTVRSSRVQDTNPTTFYNNLNDLIGDRPNSVRVIFRGPRRRLETDNYGFYVQDDVRVNQRLQLNAGLRYEYYTPLTGALNVQASNPFAPISTSTETPMFAPDRNNFAPRLGFVYDVQGNQKLILRAGYALTYGPPQPLFYYNSAFIDPRLPFNATFTARDVPANVRLTFPFPSSFVDFYVADPNRLPANLNLGRAISDFNREDEYAAQYNATVQYAVTPSVAVQAAYVGSRSYNLIGIRLPNQFIPGTNTRPRPELGNIVYRENAGRSNYDALQVSINNRFRRSVTVDFYYTFAKSNTYYAVDGTLGNQENGDIQDFNDIANSYGPKSSDIRHRIVGVHTIELPTPGFAQENSILRTLFGGFNVQGILTYRTGLPINVIANLDLVRNSRVQGARPDLVPGVNPYLDDDSDPLTYLNPAAFDFVTPFNQQRYGTLGYNALRGPSAFTYDASLIKRFRFGERQRVDFRAEFFNLLNHAVLSNPVANLSPQTNPNGSPRIVNGQPVVGANFGRITGTSNGRNIQFGLKYTF